MSPVYTVDGTIDGVPFQAVASGPIASAPGARVYFGADDTCFSYGDDLPGRKPSISVSLQVMKDGQPDGPPLNYTHFGWTRYRHIINPDTVVNSHQFCVDQGWTLPHKLPPGSSFADPGDTSGSGPMALYGISPQEGDGGERRDLGYNPEPPALWAVGGPAQPMQNWARGADALAMHVIDHTNGKPINILARPFASIRGNEADPIPGAGSASPDGYDGAHHTNASFTNFLASLKVRHLENHCSYATMTFISSSWISHDSGAGVAVTDMGQVRALGHSLKAVLQAWMATQVAEQYGLDMTNCHPSSYWKQVCANQLAFLKKTFQTNPACQRFRYFPNIGTLESWEMEWVHIAVAYGMLIDPAGWGDFGLWAYKNVYDRLGNTEWPEEYTTPYCLILGPKLQDDAHGGAMEFPTRPSYHRNPNPPAFDGQVLLICDTDPATGQPVDNLFKNWGEVRDFHLKPIADNPAGGWNITQAQAQQLLAGTDKSQFITWHPAAGMYTVEASAAYMHVKRQGKIDFSQYPQAEASHARLCQRAINAVPLFDGKMWSRLCIWVDPLGDVPPPVEPPPPPPPIEPPPPPPPPVEPPPPAPTTTLKRVPYSSITLEVATRAHNGERIVLTRNSQDFAMLIPLPGEGDLKRMRLKTSTYNSVTLQEATRAHNGEQLILTNKKTNLCIMGPVKLLATEK